MLQRFPSPIPIRLAWMSVVLALALAWALPAAAQTSTGEADEMAAGEIGSTTTATAIDIMEAERRIQAVYVTPEAEVHYDGQFLQEGTATPNRFVAEVSSESGGVFASGDFTRGGFTITLGDVKIDSTKPITQAQADAIAAFGKSQEAKVLRKLHQSLILETATADRHYVVALSALVMVADSGAGAPAQAANDCFGCCGPGCWGCTGCYTDACRAHDQCVADHGHLRCLGGLIPAIGSLISECLLNFSWWFGAAA